MANVLDGLTSEDIKYFRHEKLDLGAKQYIEWRNRMVERIDVLEKVKKVAFVDGVEFATTEQVADFYEIDPDYLRSVKIRHEEELASDGLRVWTPNAIKEYVSKPLPSLGSCNFLTFERNGTSGWTLTFESGKQMTINSRGVLLWPRRAILRAGMLLHNSKVAKAVRDALLDIEEGASPVLKTTTLESQIESLRKAVAERDAALSEFSGKLKEMGKQLVAITEFVHHHTKDVDDETIVRELSKTDSLLNRLRDGKHTVRHTIWATVNQATGMDQTKSREIFKAATNKFKDRTGKDLRGRAYATYKSTGCKPTIIGTLGGEDEASIYLDCAVEAIAEAGLLINEAAVMDMMDKKRK